MSYRGAPFDESYFIGNSGAGYTNYNDMIKWTTNRADDIEQFKPVNGINVLVMGCAFGFLVKELSNRGANVKGIDISSYAISQAQTLFPTLNFEVADAINTNEGNNQYDLVVANLLIDCMPNSTILIQLLKEIKRVINNNGIIYLLVSNTTDNDYLIISDNQYQSYVSSNFPSKTINIENVGYLSISADKRVVIY